MSISLALPLVAGCVRLCGANAISNVTHRAEGSALRRNASEEEAATSPPPPHTLMCGCMCSRMNDVKSEICHTVAMRGASRRATTRTRDYADSRI